MKICYLADGESIHVVRWCRHFLSLGHQVHLISFKAVQMEGITTHYINAGTINVEGGNWRVLLQYRKVKKIIKDINPDLLHAIYATSYGIVGALSDFHPYIVTPLGTDVLISPQRSFIYKRLLRYVFKKADHITSMAPHMTDAMLELGASAAKIGTVILGINTAIFNKQNRKLPENQFVITSIRNLEPIYNIPHFLHALAIVKPKIPNLKVNITGDGSLCDELKQLAARLNIFDIVTFYGKVSQAKIVEILNQSHISVTVSLSDGNSLSLIEAMACGAYPIATDILANRQWLKDGVNGIFVKINDISSLANSIMHVYNNFDKIIEKAMEESDRIIKEKGTWNINMQKMEQKYRQMVNNNQ